LPDDRNQGREKGRDGYRAVDPDELLKEVVQRLPLTVSVNGGFYS
jgi:hypothetical protein